MQRHAVQIAVEELKGVPLVRVSGELDLATIPDLRAAVNRITEGQPVAIVFDFRDITYLDSSGLGILVSARRRLGGHGGEVTVISEASCVVKALRLSGLDQILHVCATREEFLDSRVNV